MVLLAVWLRPTSAASLTPKPRRFLLLAILKHYHPLNFGLANRVNKANRRLFDSRELNDILNAELALGNEVAEASAWPPKCKNLVILKRRFHQPYHFTSLKYREINDPHYWYAEYSTIHSVECLACK